MLDAFDFYKTTLLTNFVYILWELLGHQGFWEKKPGRGKGVEKDMLIGNLATNLCPL